MNFFGSGPKRPTNTRLTDKDGKVRQDWLDYFDSIGGQDAQNLLVGASPARQTAEHLVAGTSTVGWDLSTAGQPKPYVPDSGIGTDQVADGAVTSDKIADGTIIPANIADHAVTLVKIQQIATDKLLGRDTAGTGDVELISVTNGLEFTGSTSIGIAADGVTNARLADMAQSTIKGRASGAGTGNPTDLSNTEVATILPDASTTQRGVTELATDAEVRSAATGALSVSSGALESAAAFVTLTDAATVALDWDTGINFTLTITANRALGNPTNGQPGTWRTIYVDGNSGTLRTLTFGANYFGDLPTLADITSSKAYLISIFCKTTSVFILKSTQAIP